MSILRLLTDSLNEGLILDHKCGYFSGRQGQVFYHFSLCGIIYYHLAGSDTMKAIITNREKGPCLRLGPDSVIHIPHCEHALESLQTTIHKFSFTLNARTVQKQGSGHMRQKI